MSTSTVTGPYLKIRCWSWESCGISWVMTVCSWPCSWPATPEVLAYVSDLETTALSSRNLRIFLQYLAERTNARQINVIGYSAGTRVVLQALSQLSLLNHGNPRAADLRIGQVVLIGSDVGRAAFAAALADGLLDMAQIHNRLRIQQKTRPWTFPAAYSAVNVWARFPRP